MAASGLKISILAACLLLFALACISVLRIRGQKAKEDICQESEFGDPKAEYKVAQEAETMSLSGPGAVKARGLMAKAAGSGHVNAEARYGGMLMSGYGGPVDTVQGLLWLRRAAATGDQTGLFDLAIAYDAGDGLAKDHMIASAYYQKVKGDKRLTARARLGWMYLWGLGVDREPIKAYQAIAEAANGGDLLGMHELGIYNMCGCFIQPSMAGVSRWLGLAAAKGFVASQQLLPLIKPYFFRAEDRLGIVPAYVI